MINDILLSLFNQVIIISLKSQFNLYIFLKLYLFDIKFWPPAQMSVICKIHTGTISWCNTENIINIIASFYKLLRTDVYIDGYTDSSLHELFNLKIC
jgi:hypothetical protein